MAQEPHAEHAAQAAENGAERQQRRLRHSHALGPGQQLVRQEQAEGQQIDPEDHPTQLVHPLLLSPRRSRPGRLFPILPQKERKIHEKIDHNLRYYRLDLRADPGRSFVVPAFDGAGKAAGRGQRRLGGGVYRIQMDRLPPQEVGRRDEKPGAGV